MGTLGRGQPASHRPWIASHEMVELDPMAGGPRPTDLAMGGPTRAAHPYTTGSLQRSIECRDLRAGPPTRLIA